MLTPYQKNVIEAYRLTMQEVKVRLHYAGELYYDRVTIGFRPMDYESIAMTFRKVAELIVFANLIGHESEYKALHPSIDQEWNMGKIINKIKAINPLYYPYPFREVLDSNGVLEYLDDLPANIWMTEQELIDMYGKCSDLIHAHNPFKGALDYAPYLKLFTEWGPKISNLISLHGVALSDGVHVIMCAMKPRSTPSSIQVGIYEGDTVNGYLNQIKE